jgi:hypothetical protein
VYNHFMSDLSKKFTNWNMVMELSVSTLISFLVFPLMYDIAFDFMGYLILSIEIVSAVFSIISSYKLKLINKKILEANLREDNDF